MTLTDMMLMILEISYNLGIWEALFQTVNEWDWPGVCYTHLSFPFSAVNTQKIENVVLVRLNSYRKTVSVQLKAQTWSIYNFRGKHLFSKEICSLPAHKCYFKLFSTKNNVCVTAGPCPSSMKKLCVTIKHRFWLFLWVFLHTAES